VLELTAAVGYQQIVVEVGGIPVRLRTTNSDFRRMLENRYQGFIGAHRRAELDFRIDLAGSKADELSDDVQVTRSSGQWSLTRGDFHAEWDPESSSGSICQSANPYSIDSVLRIVHTLALAKEGGFLVHASSVVRKSRAYLFVGPSGAGKTTMVGMAPSDVTILTDEISYVRNDGSGYTAFGTPFVGDLGKIGTNVSARIASLYLLAKGPENRIEPIATAEAVRSVLSNVLFFAEDQELVRSVFRSVCDFVGQVPTRRLTFFPDCRVWDMIG